MVVGPQRVRQFCRTKDTLFPMTAEADLEASQALACEPISQRFGSQWPPIKDNSGHGHDYVTGRADMALTNAEKQRRFRDRNVIVLTDRAEEIAEKLIDMEDQATLRKVARLVGNHLKNPNRSLDERNIDLGRVQIQGANGRPP